MNNASKVRWTAVVAAVTVSVAVGSGRVAGSDSAESARVKANRARVSAAASTHAPARDSGATFTPMALTATRNARDLANTLASNPATITGAVYTTIPALGNPVGISDVASAGFPTNGSTFGILTTGDVNLFNTANTSGGSGVSNGGGNVRGTTDRDVSILKVDMIVPAGVNCLSITFRFFSEEYPEFVGTSFNDAFIAELDTSNWATSGSTITAPNNFAKDPVGNVISINAAGTTSMTAANAAGTTYDGATPLLGASTPITPGAHSLYLSIFDQGDSIYDSAVALDSLVLGTTGPGGCVLGATPLSVVATTDRPNTDPGSTNGYTIVVRNPNATALSVNSITATLPFGYAYQTGSTTGVTTANPAQSGFDLNWNGPFSIPGSSTIQLRFNVTTSINRGVFFLNASAIGATTGVTPSGPTAVNVLNGVALGRVRDIDRDGKSDATVYHPSSGFWYSRQSQSGATFSIQYGGSGYIPVAYDYDRDGKTDIAVYHPPSGLWFVRQSSTGTTVVTGFGGTGYAPVPGDFDGDGKTDFAVFHEASGLWFVFQSSTGTSFSFAFGGPGATPVPADYDGDARTDFAVYYGGNGLWYIRSSLTSTTTSYGYGGPGYLPVAGDFDGDGGSDSAVYHSASGFWFMRNSSTGQSTTLAFGSAGALAVASDYDGDGKTDPTVYYPGAGGLWYVKNSSTGATTSFAFGGQGFNPIEPPH